jgi:DHA1 family multidrug resistance protein-like MFS transporter
VQYRRLGKEVEDEAKKQSTPTRRSSARASSNLESGQRPTVQHLDGIDKKGRQWMVSLAEDDPLDPKNWPLVDRCKNIAISSFLIFTQA